MSLVRSGIDVLFRAQIVLKALSGARPRYFSLLAQRKVPKRNGTRRLAPCYRKGCPVLLTVSGARELPPFGRSDMHALVPGNGCDARQRQRDLGCTDLATEFRSAGFGRGAQGSRSVAETKPWGCLSFAFFSLGK